METSKKDIDIDEYEIHSSIDQIKLYCLYVSQNLDLEKQSVKDFSFLPSLQLF